ncbi:hypothetical protein CJ179_46395 [Rhodococcus sp. ACS1]|uniref:hypothetical protein n=1 Tax=Rhodococcus sp. ACS1 TaxID=2028570 RepID=UPI000BB10369|nr:hypothetical protein [Rhodococcus sp. ACS1]PBC35515.1 hypothetical protein CJ179_46395 [Rhodococcus sp. ACS1]
MTTPLTPREQALRRLPQPYSLALRLRDAGVPDDQMCNYLDIDTHALPLLLELADAKLTAALHTTPVQSEGQP